jgi:outer membrane lipoprotein SlyB
MSFHFFVNAMSLEELRPEGYRRTGRRVMAGAVLAGCGAAVLAGAGSPTYAAAAAFVAGGILVNVFKEELPAERSIRFGAFALGAACFTASLLRASAAE